VFVHAAGFIGGNDTYDGALAMATAALPVDSDMADAPATKKARTD
jgi:hypothetical protein